MDAAINDFDLPARFLPCMVLGLASSLALKRNPAKFPILQPLYETALQSAIRYDEDRSSVHLVPHRTYV